MRKNFRVFFATILSLLLVSLGFVTPRNIGAQQRSGVKTRQGLERPTEAIATQASPNAGVGEEPSASFTNPAAIAFGTGGPNNGSLYPSPIVVSGLSGTVTRVLVQISNFSHTFPDDLGFVLVGPTGAALLLQDSAGDDPDMVNITYTLSDSGATQLPDLTAWTAGVYKPTAYFAGDSFPAPGPLLAYNNPGPVGGGTATFASTFNGSAPNGTWNLYARDFVTGDGGSIAGGWTLGITTTAPTAAPATISGRITTPDGSSLGGTVMHLSGSASRTTISDGAGNYRFENVETDNFYTVTPSLANYHFAPANRSFSLTGNMTDAAFTANADASQSANAIDMTEYFVRQHYLDFLGREPDQGGLDYWSSQINPCNGDAACISRKRIDVSAAFFMSAEFQQTGSYVYGLYAGTLGRTLHYGEFNADRAQVLGGSGLDEAKTTFTKNFVERPEFTSRYPQGMTREHFVDAVIQTMTQRSGVDQSSLRNQLLGDYDAGGRALVARHASEASSFAAAEYNKAFVLMEYFGYLRRPEDQGGYEYWLSVLNNNAAGNYRGMVCAFLTSTEYQFRFSTVVARSNAECGP